MNLVDAIVSGKFLEAEQMVNDQLYTISKGMVDDRAEEIGSTLFGGQGQVSESIDYKKPHEKFTGYSEWNQEVSYTSHGDHKVKTDKKTGDEVAIMNKKEIGRWSHEEGHGVVYS